MKGYKYRGIEYFVRDIETLLKNQIYASQFVYLNDPFEGMYNEEIIQLVKFFEKTFKVESSEVIDNFNEIRKYKSKLGIYSLSNTYLEELMWAHYANSHKGFCIEYDIIKLKDKYLAPETVIELGVDYEPEPQTINHLDIKERNKILKKLFATKSLKWNYEKEIRLIFDSFGLKDYHPSALTGIYFGTEFPSSIKQLLIDSLSDRDVLFYEMSRENNSYNLRRKLVHENKRIIQKKLNPEIYEILSTKHYPKVENFNVLYKGEKDKDSLTYFFESFRENHATKNCNINLFDDKSILSLIDKDPLEDSDYIKVANHFIALSSFEMPHDFSWYPYKDFQYEQ